MASKRGPRGSGSFSDLRIIDSSFVKQHSIIKIGELWIAIILKENIFYLIMPW